MKISDNAAELLAALSDLQRACTEGMAGSIEQLAERCQQAASRLSFADFAACDEEVRTKLRRTARTTTAFLRRLVRSRGMHLTMRRFGQMESATKHRIAM